ncbi:Hypothetical protein FKW44_022881 [Caligus rogercresseyi]|uniref:Uncharacterized protein n=1 Tax=Caligus rogercresseyi TaxID=217165 RepID=A0A7T8GN40_CALRO|nr:Hypothetical protein FKW44_022881 [Caligus rogercresseyi]
MVKIPSALGTLEVRDKFFQGQRLCRFCNEYPETTEHIFWIALRFEESLICLRNSQGEFGAEIGREDFLAFYRGEEESKSMLSSQKYNK